MSNIHPDETHSNLDRVRKATESSDVSSREMQDGPKNSVR